ncbi:unnamed protein product [Cyprideis torosa]|uniref:Uncharacterized protein n=1 Tax=Cyprideis torosa TaxID=163714 RepID=A0A7R8W8R1_9CRUS|nr:unnamed protein product [Cyprideis torosa]CAG0883736.1 unnamed protein product [Cyprideis torosa]
MEICFRMTSLFLFLSLVSLTLGSKEKAKVTPLYNWIQEDFQCKPAEGSIPLPSGTKTVQEICGDFQWIIAVDDINDDGFNGTYTAWMVTLDVSEGFNVGIIYSETVEVPVGENALDLTESVKVKEFRYPEGFAEKGPCGGIMLMAGISFEPFESPELGGKVGQERKEKLRIQCEDGEPDLTMRISPEKYSELKFPDVNLTKEIFEMFNESRSLMNATGLMGSVNPAGMAMMGGQMMDSLKMMTSQMSQMIQHGDVSVGNRGQMGGVPMNLAPVVNGVAEVLMTVLQEVMERIQDSELSQSHKEKVVEILQEAFQDVEGNGPNGNEEEMANMVQNVGRMLVQAQAHGLRGMGMNPASVAHSMIKSLMKSKMTMKCMKLMHQIMAYTAANWTKIEPSDTKSLKDQIPDLSVAVRVDSGPNVLSRTAMDGLNVWAYLKRLSMKDLKFHMQMGDEEMSDEDTVTWLKPALGDLIHPGNILLQETPLSWTPEIDANGKEVNINKLYLRETDICGPAMIVFMVDPTTQETQDPNYGNNFITIPVFVDCHRAAMRKAGKNIGKVCSATPEYLQNGQKAYFVKGDFESGNQLTVYDANSRSFKQVDSKSPEYWYLNIHGANMERIVERVGEYFKAIDYCDPEEKMQDMKEKTLLAMYSNFVWDVQLAILNNMTDGEASSGLTDYEIEQAEIMRSLVQGWGTLLDVLKDNKIPLLWDAMDGMMAFKAMLKEGMKNSFKSIIHMVQMQEVMKRFGGGSGSGSSSSEEKGSEEGEGSSSEEGMEGSGDDSEEDSEEDGEEDMFANLKQLLRDRDQNDDMDMFFGGYDLYGGDAGDDMYDLRSLLSDSRGNSDDAFRNMLSGMGQQSNNWMNQMGMQNFPQDFRVTGENGMGSQGTFQDTIRNALNNLAGGGITPGANGMNFQSTGGFQDNIKNFLENMGGTGGGAQENAQNFLSNMGTGGADFTSSIQNALNNLMGNMPSSSSGMSSFGSSSFGDSSFGGMTGKRKKRDAPGMPEQMDEVKRMIKGMGQAMGMMGMGGGEGDMKKKILRHITGDCPALENEDLMGREKVSAMMNCMLQPGRRWMLPGAEPVVSVNLPRIIRGLVWKDRSAAPAYLAKLEDYELDNIGNALDLLLRGEGPDIMDYCRVAKNFSNAWKEMRKAAQMYGATPCRIQDIENHLEDLIEALDADIASASTYAANFTDFDEEKFVNSLTFVKKMITMMSESDDAKWQLVDLVNKKMKCMAAGSKMLHAYGKRDKMDDMEKMKQMKCQQKAASVIVNEFQKKGEQMAKLMGEEEADRVMKIANTTKDAPPIFYKVDKEKQMILRGDFSGLNGQLYWSPIAACTCKEGERRGRGFGGPGRGRGPSMGRKPGMGGPGGWSGSGDGGWSGSGDGGWRGSGDGDWRGSGDGNWGGSGDGNWDRDGNWGGEGSGEWDDYNYNYDNNSSYDDYSSGDHNTTYVDYYDGNETMNESMAYQRRQNMQDFFHGLTLIMKETGSMDPAILEELLNHEDASGLEDPMFLQYLTSEQRKEMVPTDDGKINTTYFKSMMEGFFQGVLQDMDMTQENVKALAEDDEQMEEIGKGLLQKFCDHTGAPLCEERSK